MTDQPIGVPSIETFDALVRKVQELEGRLGGDRAEYDPGRAPDAPFPALTLAPILPGTMGPIQRQRNTGTLSEPTWVNATMASEMAYLNPEAASLGNGVLCDVYRDPSSGILRVCHAVGRSCDCPILDLVDKLFQILDLQGEEYDPTGGEGGGPQTIEERIEELRIACDCGLVTTCGGCTYRLPMTLTFQNMVDHLDGGGVTWDWSDLEGQSISVEVTNDNGAICNLTKELWAPDTGPTDPELTVNTSSGTATFYGFGNFVLSNFRQFAWRSAQSSWYIQMDFEGVITPRKLIVPSGVVGCGGIDGVHDLLHDSDVGAKVGELVVQQGSSGPPDPADVMRFANWKGPWNPLGG